MGSTDADDPYITVLAGANLEFIHHMSEIALLRDLWRAGVDGNRTPAGRERPGRGR